MTETVAVAVETIQDEPTIFELVATNAAQLANAHDAMRVWLAGAREGVQSDLERERVNLTIAHDKKWSTAPFKPRIRNLERRLEFFDKIGAAVDAGFVLIPNFEMDIFAIRTDRARPERRARVVQGSWTPDLPDETARILPTGEGEYQNPVQSVRVTRAKEGDKTFTTAAVVGGWRNIDFPLALAKPVLMTRTAEAMALKIFDEFGVARDTQRRGSRRGDPIIIGRIRNPAQWADVSCFIGWTFDPSVL